jgi:TetR/AcrR family transcriptional regulator
MSSVESRRRPNQGARRNDLPGAGNSVKLAAMERKKPGRDEILAMAIEEFAAHGYEGATTAGIARRAEVTQPLVHHHFGSKLGLYEAAIDQVFGAFVSAFERAQQECESFGSRERLQHLLFVLLRFNAQEPSFSGLRHGAHGEAYELLYSRWLTKLVDIFKKEITRAIKAGAVRDDIDQRCMFFLLVGALDAPFRDVELSRRSFGLDLRKPKALQHYARAVMLSLFEGLAAS